MYIFIVWCFHKIAFQAPKYRAEWNIKPENSRKIDALSTIDNYDDTKEKNNAAGIMKFTYLKSITIN